MFRRLTAMIAMLVAALATSSTPSFGASQVSVDCGAGADLQAAIDAAPAGAILDISGTCVGRFTIGKHLVLRGVSNAVLDAQRQGATLTVTRATVRVTKMTITGGHEFSGPGGILNYGTLVLVQVTVTGNSAQLIGGIDSLGTLTLDRSIVTANQSDYSIGGIFNDCGKVTISRSTVSSNRGVGISSGSSCPASLTLVDSTVNDNVADGSVAAGVANRFGATATIIRSTIVHNVSLNSPSGAVSPSPGGVSNDGSLSIVASTITRNEGDHAPGGVLDTTGQTTIAGSILAVNRVWTGEPWDCAGAITSRGYTFVGTTVDPPAYPNVPCSFAAAVGDHIGTSPPLDPILKLLGNYSGLTQTVMPQPTSPAVDAIPIGALATDGTALCPASGSTDQRGKPRPHGSACDIGSVER